MIRQKKIFIFSIQDNWFEDDKFLTEKYPLTILHSNHILPEKDYDFQLSSYTFLLDIGLEKEEIFKKFDYKSARYSINKAIKENVDVRKVETVEEFEKFYTFQIQFCEERKLPICSLQELKMLDCYYAVAGDGEYLGGCAFLTNVEDKFVRYKYGATLHKKNANEMILWKAICDYHDAGFLEFDLGGVVPTDDKTSYYYRHFSFKKKFGGELIGSYTYFKIRGFYRVFYYIFKLILNIFFKGDLNGCIVFFNKIHLIH